MYWEMNDSIQFYLFIYLQNTGAVLFWLVEASHMLQCRGTELFLEILIRPNECDRSLHWTLWPQLQPSPRFLLCVSWTGAPELLNTKASIILTSHLRFEEHRALTCYKGRDAGPFFLLIGLFGKGLREGICSQAALMLIPSALHRGASGLLMCLPLC